MLSKLIIKKFQVPVGNVMKPLTIVGEFCEWYHKSEIPVLYTAAQSHNHFLVEKGTKGSWLSQSDCVWQPSKSSPTAIEKVKATLHEMSIFFPIKLFKMHSQRFEQSVSVIQYAKLDQGEDPILYPIEKNPDGWISIGCTFLLQPLYCLIMAIPSESLLNMAEKSIEPDIRNCWNMSGRVRDLLLQDDVKDLLVTIQRQNIDQLIENLNIRSVKLDLIE